MVLILGVGQGTFTLAFFWALAVFLVIVFAKAQGGLAYVGIGAVLVAGLLTGILIALPREPKNPTQEESVVIYDYAIIYRYLMISGCALFLIIGLLAYLLLHVMQPIYAKPLRKVF